MSTLTVRNVPEEIQRALKVRAAQAGRSTEAELRLIIADTVMPKINIADELLAIGQSLGGLEIEFARDKRVFKPSVFE